MKQFNWEQVTQCEDVYDTYDKFITVIKELYNKTCPVKKVKGKKQLRQPWLSNALINACKKQKALYKRFLRSRTTENEMRYKAYKNKLTSIKRFCKKKYYNELLENNKHNVKGTWKVLNEILNKQQKQLDYPDIFRNEIGTPVRGYINIANKFNEFLTYVGPKLASKIQNLDNENIYDYLIQTNNNSMYLNPVDNQEIMNIVHDCKNKSSEDYDGMNMNTVKYIIHDILEPLTYICNLSFEKGNP